MPLVNSKKVSFPLQLNNTRVREKKFWIQHRKYYAFWRKLKTERKIFLELFPRYLLVSVFVTDFLQILQDKEAQHQHVGW